MFYALDGPCTGIRWEETPDGGKPVTCGEPAATRVPGVGYRCDACIVLTIYGAQGELAEGATPVRRSPPRQRRG